VTDDAAGPGALTRLYDSIGRWMVGWHVVFIGLALVAGTVVQFDADLSLGQRLGALGLIGVLIAWYLVAGWPRLGTESEPLGVAYIIGAWVLYVGVVALSENGQVFFLLFALIPQCWLFLKPKQAVIMTAAGSLTLALTQLALNGWAADAVADIVPWVVVQTVVSLLMGLFVTGVFTEAERRAVLIDELERTRSELATTERERGALAERERLAHEIHDTLAQGFTSVLTLAQAIEVAIDHDPDTARQRLRLLEETARENLAEARALVGGLRPVGLQQTSLVEAVRRVADRAARSDGFGVDVGVEGTPRTLTLDEDVIVLRTAQEALANVRQHAGASRVGITISFPGERGIMLTVRDDGQGFDPNRPTSGYGITGMAERAAQVGGRATVASDEGSGTVVTVALPGLG
jgi:signal transduction histidine kinase